MSNYNEKSWVEETQKRRYGREDNVKISHRELGCEYLDWMLQDKYDGPFCECGTEPTIQSESGEYPDRLSESDS